MSSVAWNFPVHIIVTWKKHSGFLHEVTLMLEVYKTMAERANFLTVQTAQTSKKVQNVRVNSKNVAD